MKTARSMFLAGVLFTQAFSLSAMDDATTLFKKTVATGEFSRLLDFCAANPGLVVRQASLVDGKWQLQLFGEKIDLSTLAASPGVDGVTVNLAAAQNGELTLKQTLPALEDFAVSARTPLANQDFLAHMPALKTLHLSYGGHETTRPGSTPQPLPGIADCRQLETLYVFGLVDAVSFAKGLPLRELSTGMTMVSDLSPVAEAPLTLLHLNSEWNVKTLPEPNAWKLVNLRLVDTALKQLPRIDYSALTHVALAGDPFADLSPLKDAPLEMLDLGFRFSWNGDISPLEGKKIKTLMIAVSPTGWSALAASLNTMEWEELTLMVGESFDLSLLKPKRPGMKVVLKFPVSLAPPAGGARVRE